MKRLMTSILTLFLLANISLVTVHAGQHPKPTPPVSVVIDAISHLYQPVEFDHQLHAEYAACSECHHHLAGLPASRPQCAECHGQAVSHPSQISCGSCHLPTPERRGIEASEAEKPRYHIDVAGLMGAYHLSCIECHEGIGAGPTDCLSCHELTDQGKRFYRLKDSRDSN